MKCFLILKIYNTLIITKRFDMHYSIVPYIDIERTSDFRIDGEYWHPEFIENASLISDENRISSIINPDISNIKSSPINRSFEYLEISNISYASYQTSHVKKGEEPSRAHHILKKNDIVVSTVRPNRNAVAVIMNDGIIGSSGLSVLRPNGIEAEYLFAFCKTDYFIKCLVRATKATMYPAVSNSDVIGVPILIPTLNFREKIKKNVKEAFSNLSLAEKKYQDAQKILLSELKLTKWHYENQMSFVKNYSTINKAGRTDAEYYKPRYEKIMSTVKRCQDGWDELGNLTSRMRGIEVGSEKYLADGIPFVRVSNLSPFEITEEKYVSEDLHKENHQCQPMKGEILLSKDATPGIAHYLREAPPAMIPSSGVLRLKVIDRRINAEYLTLVLNSLIVKEQIDRAAGGSVITHWRPEQIEQTVIPILAKEKQEKIRKKIQESFELRKQSKHLLAMAKSAVSFAIEKNEREAVSWMEKKV